MAELQKTGFLDDHQGNPSSMRVMSVIALLASIGFGVITVLYPEENNQGLYITTVFLIAAFAPKALQKFRRVPIPPQERILGTVLAIGTFPAACW